MIQKPDLSHATVKVDIRKMKRPEYFDEAAWEHLKKKGGREIGSESGEFAIGARFRIEKYEFKYDADGYKCDGAKNWLSLFKIRGGCNNLKYFAEEGAEKSDDYDSIPANKILDLPMSYNEAKLEIENNYI